MAALPLPALAMRRLSLALALMIAAAGCGASEVTPAKAAAPPAAPAAPLAIGAAEGPKLAFPLACRIGVDCEIQHYVDRDPTSAVLDYRCGRRTYEGHDAVDIRVTDMAVQARGVDVLAAATGRVLRLRDGVQDISVREVGVAAVSPIGCGNAVVIDHGGGWQTSYCHMAQGSVRVKEGEEVAAGQPVGRVGLSGLTEFPHLHMGVRHNGQVVDPFAPGPVAPGACPTQAGMWTPEAARQLAYKAGTILSAGFSGEAVTMPVVEAGRVAPFSTNSAVLATYMFATGLEAGDELELVLTGPGGAPLSQQRLPPLASDRAQQFQMIGKKRPPAGWPAGEYRSDLRIWRAGKVAAERTLTTRV